MRRVVCLLLGSVAMWACGGSHGGTPVDGGGDAAGDASIDAPNVDASTDAPPDGPSGTPAALLVSDGTATITQWVAPPTFAGGSAAVNLFVFNDGSATTGALTSTIAGSNTASFAIDAANSTCGSALVAGDGCWLRLDFAPSAAGDYAATLDVTGGSASVDLPLIATVPTSPGGALVANVASVDYGMVAHGGSDTAQLILSNTSGAAITLGARTATAPFAVVTDNCASPLPGGHSCTVTLSYRGSALGLSTGTFAVTSSANTVDVPLRGIALRDVTVEKTGFGTGTVTSMPTGITCGSTCAGSFALGIPIELTASTDASNLFVAWGGGCAGSASSCAMASPADGAVTAQFVASTAKTISIAFAGTSVGKALVADSTFGTPYGTCTSDCVVYVPDDGQISLYGYSPSTFGGWSGDCVSATSECDLGTVTSNQSVTVTNFADMYEVSTLLPADAITGLAVAPSGDIIIATSESVSEVTTDGTTVWSTPIAGGAISLATDSAGNVYGVGSASTFALTSAGAVSWTRAFGGVPVGGQSFDESIATSPDGTVIAVLTGSGTHVVDGSGSDRFTITGLSPAPQTVAVGADGTVALAQLDVPLGTDQAQALLYSSAGSALRTLAPLPGDYDASIAFDEAGAICAVTTGFGEATTSCETTIGSAVFAHVDRNTFPRAMPAGVVTDTSGEILMVGELNDAAISGLQLEVFSGSGSVILLQPKPPATVPSDPNGDGVTPVIIAAGGSHRIAVAGTYDYNTPWIQIYDVP